MHFLDEADVRRIVREELAAWLEDGKPPSREEVRDLVQAMANDLVPVRFPSSPLPEQKQSDQEASGSAEGPCKEDSQVQGQVQEGTLWKHQNGTVYIVIGVGSLKRDDGKLRPCVIFKDYGKGGEVFVRDLGNFLSRFTRVE